MSEIFELSTDVFEIFSIVFEYGTLLQIESLTS